MLWGKGGPQVLTRSHVMCYSSSRTNQSATSSLCFFLYKLEEGSNDGVSFLLSSILPRPLSLALLSPSFLCGITGSTWFLKRAGLTDLRQYTHAAAVEGETRSYLLVHAAYVCFAHARHLHCQDHWLAVGSGKLSKSGEKKEGMVCLGRIEG